MAHSIITIYTWRTPCTIGSKINITPKDVYLLISKLHSILAVANLLAHNNISRICYCGQISLQSAAVNCIFSDSLAPLRISSILLAIVYILFVQGVTWGWEVPRGCSLWRSPWRCWMRTRFGVACGSWWPPSVDEAPVATDEGLNHQPFGTLRQLERTLFGDLERRD